MPFAAAAAGAIGVIGSSLISSNASTDAANTQANAANNATALQKQMFDQTQSNLKPYMDTGQNALASLLRGIGLLPGGDNTIGQNASLVKPFSISQYQQSPGYAFQMQQGIDAINNSAAARGGINSGNTLKALDTYGQGLANQDYQQAYGNYVGQQQQLFNFLQTLSGSGQNAAANLGSLGSQTAGQIGQNIQAAGNAQAAGTVANANSLNNLISGLTSQSFLSGIGGGSSGGGGGTYYGTPIYGTALSN